MLDRDQIFSGLKVRLLADLGLFLEGTQGVIQRVTDDSSSIWHAVVAWRCPAQEEKNSGDSEAGGSGLRGSHTPKEAKHLRTSNYPSLFQIDVALLPSPPRIPLFF
jgi:hypothetical protein